jgi:HlyD family secretion protein
MSLATHRRGQFVLLALGVSVGCARSPAPDAYGNVEATEVVVSAEGGGHLVAFDVEEGQLLAAGVIVGAIDASQLGFDRDQLTAERAANVARAAQAGRQARALEAERGATQAQQDAAKAQRSALGTELEIARRAYERTQRLFSQQAATAQQLDQAERDYRVLQDQIKAQDLQIASHGREGAAQEQRTAATEAEQQAVAHQTASFDAQIARVNDRIAKTRITNPRAGTVLVTYARAGEVVQTGQPLYKIANLEEVDVRAYVTEPELSAIRVGQQAQVSADIGQNQRQAVTGTISWISRDAEFTPTPIQTREERTGLVYAVKIHVPNRDGRLKIGMPVDVLFSRAGAPQ